MQPLFDLPAELLLAIVRYLHPIELNSLVQTCQYAYDCLSPVLHREAATYTFDDEHGDPVAHWAIYHQNLSLLKKLLDVNSQYFTRSVLAGCLQRAMDVRNFDMVRIIVERDPDLIKPSAALGLFNDAAERNQPRMVRLLFDLGARIELDANSRDPGDKSPLPLRHAVLAPSVEMAQYIIRAGECPCRTDSRGLSPLHIAVAMGDLAMTELLLEAGADISANSDGRRPIYCLALTPRGLDCRTPFETFVGENKEAVLKTLLSWGADPNERFDDIPLLHPLCMRKKNTLVKILADAGADISEIGFKSITLLHFLARLGKRDDFEYFLRAGVDILSLDKQGCNTLHYAAMGGDVGILEICLEAGLDPSATNMLGLAPWSYAMRYGNEEVFLRLCEITPAEAMRFNDKEVPYKPLQKGSVIIIKAFLDGRDGPRWIDSYDDHCLAKAMRENHVSVVEILLGYRADPDRPLISSIPSQSPLQYAIDEQCDSSIIKLLLRAGANTSKISLPEPSNTPDYGTIARMLLDAGAPILDEYLGQVAASGHVTVLQRFIDAGLDPTTPNNSRNAALLTACQYGTLEVVEVLLNAGCDPCFADSDGRTLLSHAAQLRLSQAEILEILLDKGADFSTVDNKGMSPLHYAVEIGLEDHVQSLIDAGAGIFLRDHMGRSPFLLAVKYSLRNIITQLLDAERAGIALGSKGATDSEGAAVDPMPKSTLVAIGDNRGHTPLHEATRALVYEGCCSRKIVDLLLAVGADTEAKNDSGETALDQAKKFKRERLADAIYIHRQEQRVR